jgi:hypothetical protein
MLATIVLTVGILLATTGSAVARIGFDRLVDIQFRERPAEWEAAGRPVGGSATRKQVSFWRRGFSTHRQFYKWLAVPPEWALASGTSRPHARKMRMGAAMLFTGVLLAGAGIVLFNFE